MYSLVLRIVLCGKTGSVNNCLHRSKLFFSPVLSLCPREKAKELHDWMTSLESEKFDHLERLKKQKYEIGRAHV